MKLTKATLLLLLITGLSFTACKKDKNEPDDDAVEYGTTSSTDNSLADKLMTDAFNQVDATASDEDSLKANTQVLASCADVTVEASNNPSASNPNELWIDFGSGCTDSAGVTRKGNIHATMTGKYRDSGTVITTHLIDYYVNDHKVEGVKTVTNEGHNSDGNLWYSIKVDSVKVTDPDNNWTATWESDRTREWVEGEGTKWNPWDDVYELDGTAQGVNRSGRSYDVEITTPLEVKIGCPWVRSGQLEVRPDSLATRYVDYGNGKCDSEATVTVNGNNYTIHVQ